MTGTLTKLVVLLSAILFGVLAPAQKQTAPDLGVRLQAVQAAQQTGDPAQIAEANKLLLATALREMASLHATVDKNDTAAELTKRSLNFEDTSDSHLQLAILYTRLGQTEDAVGQVAQVLAADPKNAGAWNLQGKIWMMKKEYQKAADSLAQSLALENDPEVAYTMATALLRAGQVEKAAAVFQQLQSASGNLASGHILAGRAYENANLPSQAEAEYKKAIELDAKASRGHYFLGLFYLTRNGWAPTPQARSEFEAETAINADDFFGNYFLGYLLSLEKNYDESDRYLNVAARARPDWPEPYLYLGLNAYSAGLYARAELPLRKAIQLTGENESRNNYQIRRAYFALGRCLTINGKSEEGNKFLRRSREMEATIMANDHQQALATEQAAPGAGLEQAPIPASKASGGKSDPTAVLDAQVWKSASLPDKEKTAAQETERRLRGILANAYNDLGTSQARRHEYELAGAYFRDAERWDPKLPGLMRNLGFASFLSKNYTESARALKVVADLDPSDQRSVGMLALSFYSLKNYPEAAKTFDRIPDMASSDPRMAYGWALSLAKTKNAERASSVLAKLAAQPIPPEMLVLVGQLYSEMGDQKNAQSCYQKAKDQNPDIVIPR